MTEVAILRDNLAAVILMLFIMATETTVAFIFVLVTKMAFVCSPKDFSRRPDVGRSLTK